MISIQGTHRSLIRKIYGALFYYSGLTNLWRLSNRGKPQVWILGYHQIDRSSFQAHLRYLIKHYKIVSLHEAYLMLLGKRELRPGALALTFDDGHRSFYRQVFPLLQKYRVPATLFVATDFMGTGKLYWFDWVDAIIDQTKARDLQIGDQVYAIPEGDRSSLKGRVHVHLKAMPEEKKNAALEAMAAQGGYQASQIPEETKVIDWTQAAEMQASGLVDIGGHTCSHPILTRIPGSVARQEISESKRILQTRLGASVDFFAYPNGGAEDINQEIVRYVKEAGYLAAVTLIEGVCRVGEDPFTWRRISASGRFTCQTLATKLSGLWMTRNR
jgi:peptidoglycan/xylan/chitin deacetylase (PgdA/CDA1 family)